MAIIIFDERGAKIINGKNVTCVSVGATKTYFWLVGDEKPVAVQYKEIKDKSTLRSLAHQIALFMMEDTVVEFDWILEYAKKVKMKEKKKE